MVHQHRNAGFTLIEMLVVIVLLATLSALLLPEMGILDNPRMHSASRVLTKDLQYASQRAISTGYTHRWIVNLDQQKFRTEKLNETWPERNTELPAHGDLLDLTPPLPEREYVPVDNQTGSWRWLDEDRITIDELAIGDEILNVGDAGIRFAPDGAADPAEIWLSAENGDVLRIRIIAFTGEIRVDENPVY